MNLESNGSNTDRSFRIFAVCKSKVSIGDFHETSKQYSDQKIFSYCSRILLLIRDRLQQNIQKTNSYICSRTSDSNFRFQWIRIQFNKIHERIFSLSLLKECSHCPSWKNVLTVNFERMFPLSLLKEYSHRPF